MSKNQKRLSLPRLFISLVILAGLAYGGFWLSQNWQQVTQTQTSKPWFAPYVDVTATPQFAFEQPEVIKNSKNLALAFIVSGNDPCTPTWGKAYSLKDAGGKLDLDRRIARFRQQGGNVTISFGGQANDELALKCTDDKKLKAAYLAVINRYKIDTIDIDLEGTSLSHKVSITRRANALAEIQRDLNDNGKHLAIWLTLPVSPEGLTEEGIFAVSEMLKNDVDLTGVNAMTMNYGDSKSQGQTMNQASQDAMNALHRQLGVIYSQKDINLNSASLWSKLGATVMIGQNDVPNDIFTLEDAQNFSTFLLSKNAGRLSMWSANRDIECGENYVNTTIVSTSCSGVNQEKNAFSQKLGESFVGHITASSGNKTKADPKQKQTPDDPKKSPYQIWSETGTYLEGTRVVWHHNVYQAKWWTKSDLPDNPTLQTWQTPWKLIGPVLPGDKPIPQPTLPEGTYPKWAGTETYEGGDRVLFNGIPYQAKWWTQGESPAISSSNPDNSPWLMLTPEQIEDLIKNLGLDK